MTTDNSTIKVGDMVKVVDAQHYAAGNLGVVKSVAKDVHKVEVTLANGIVETIDLVKAQLGAIEAEVVQGLGIVKTGTDSAGVSDTAPTASAGSAPTTPTGNPVN